MQCLNFPSISSKTLRLIQQTVILKLIVYSTLGLQVSNGLFCWKSRKRELYHVIFWNGTDCSLSEHCTKGMTVITHTYHQLPKPRQFSEYLNKTTGLMQPSLSQVTHEKKGQNLWLIRENSWNDPSVQYSADKLNFPPCLQPTAPAAPSLAIITFLLRTAETRHSSCETCITPSEEKTAH